MSNYSILEQNLKDTFETDEGFAAFLWASSLPEADPHKYKAEAFAREIDRLAPTVWWAVVAAAENFVAHGGEAIGDDVREDLFRFVMDRHTFWRFPGRKTGWTRLLPDHDE